MLQPVGVGWKALRWSDIVSEMMLLQLVEMVVLVGFELVRGKATG